MRARSLLLLSLSACLLAPAVPALASPPVSTAQGYLNAAHQVYEIRRQAIDDAFASAVAAANAAFAATTAEHPDPASKIEARAVLFLAMNEAITEREYGLSALGDPPPTRLDDVPSDVPPSPVAVAQVRAESLHAASLAYGAALAANPGSAGQSARSKALATYRSSVAAAQITALLDLAALAESPGPTGTSPGKDHHDAALRRTP